MTLQIEMCKYGLNVTLSQSRLSISQCPKDKLTYACATFLFSVQTLVRETLQEVLMIRFPNKPYLFFKIKDNFV